MRPPMGPPRAQGSRVAPKQQHLSGRVYETAISVNPDQTAQNDMVPRAQNHVFSSYCVCWWKGNERVDYRKLVDVISGDLMKASEMNPDQKLFQRLSHMRTGRFCGGSGWRKASQQEREQQALLWMEKCKQWGPGGLGWLYFCINS